MPSTSQHRGKGSSVGQDIKRCILKLGYRCNNRCIFCHSQEHKLSAWLSVEQVKQRLEAIWSAGFDQVCFSGGEPTIHPDFLEIAGHCAETGHPFGLITNARMLSVESFFSQVVNRGLKYAYLSLHGRAPVHDAITQTPGSHAQTWRAIQALSQHPEIDTTVNMVVTSRNLSEIPVLVRAFAPLAGRVRLKFSLVEPRGAALDDPSLHPHPQLAAAAVVAGLGLWQQLGGVPSAFGVDGFPHCLAPAFANLQDDMYSHGIVALQELADSTIFAVDYNNMRKPAACLGCLVGDECRCTWAETLEEAGSDWLRPVHGYLPNSFNYLPSTEDAPRAVDRSSPRHLCADLGSGPQWFHTDTGDFSDIQLQRIVGQLGQVYVQQDEALFLDDFAGQLRKLVPQWQPPAKGAPTVWKPSAEELFLKADLPVRAQLDLVTGNVADIGCGPAYYFERLLPGIRSGSLRYLGVDPSPGAAILQAQQEGLIQLQRCGVEQASLPRGTFDWILVLRSHNHLADLWGAYRRMVGALKWGGKLLVVDNIAFGLVRPKLAKTSLDSIPSGTGLEHLRDHDGHQALRFLSRFPLRPLYIQHLGPDTADQWVLLFEKAWPSGMFGEEAFG